MSRLRIKNPHTFWGVKLIRQGQGSAHQAAVVYAKIRRRLHAAPFCQSMVSLLHPSGGIEKNHFHNANCSARGGSPEAHTLPWENPDERVRGKNAVPSGLVPAGPGHAVVARGSGAGQDKQGHKKDKTPSVRLVARCDRDDAIYHVGDKAKFILTSTNAGRSDLSAQRRRRGHHQRRQGQLEARRSVQPYRHSRQAGLFATARDQGKTRFSPPPPSIRPRSSRPRRCPRISTPSGTRARRSWPRSPWMPSWKNRKSYSSDRVTCYKITLANVGGKRVHGWLSVPKGNGPFPAILTVPGAGVSGNRPGHEARQHAALCR